MPYAARARGVLGRWLREQGRDEEAAQPLAEAREALGALGADAWLAELDRPLGEPTRGDQALVGAESTES